MNNPHLPIEIFFSRKKLIRLLAICIAFVAIGLWWIIAPPAETFTHLGIDIPLQALGWISAVFFGVILVFVSRKLFDKDPALVITDLGLEDRTSMVSGGFIMWNNIASVSILEIKKQRMLSIQLHDSRSMLQDERGMLHRIFFYLNNLFYKTHVSISANALDIDFDRLYLLVRNMAEKKNRTVHP